MKYMFYKKPAPRDTPSVPHKYSLLEPITVRVRRPLGNVELVSYGIGEILEVMEPSIQYLSVPHERLTEIPLSDGSFIVEFPTSVRTSRLVDPISDVW